VPQPPGVQPIDRLIAKQTSRKIGQMVKPQENGDRHDQDKKEPIDPGLMRGAWYMASRLYFHPRSPVLG
jgi:hypothetical protein